MPRTMKYQNSRAGSVEPSSMRVSTAAKSVLGWRFEPACCAAQSVHRARRRSGVLRFEPVQFPKATVAIPVKGKSALQKKFRSAKSSPPLERCTSDIKITCAVPPLQVNWIMATRTLLLRPPVLPNWALNRTYCGGPAFGLQKPSPNTSPPQ